jgi:hypothetical protein
VAPGASCVVQVQFAPTGSSGARTGTLRISSNTGSTTGSVFVNTDVTLEGTATAPVPTP